MPIEITIPSVGESITEVQITEWLKAEGDIVKAEEAVAVIDSDKTTFDLTAPQGGRLTKILFPAGEKVNVGATVAQLEPEGSAGQAQPAEKKAPEKSEAAGKAKTEKPQPAPAKEEKKQPEPEAAAPKPVKETPKASNGEPAAAKAEVKAPATKPTGAAGREEEVVPMTMLRQAVARNLVEAKQTMAMLTTFNEVDMSAIMALRKQHQESFEKKYQVKLGFMSFFVKAVIDSLKQFPQLNAEIRGHNLIYRNYFDIGVAIASDRGLVVPTLRNAERMSFADLEKTVADLAKRARDGKLKPDELQGGTFTITNGGSFGSLLSTPIINPPQSGILGMHSIQERPVAVEGQVVIRPMMYIALTYDHRIVDGREAVLFLRRVKEAAETPVRMLIEI